MELSSLSELVSLTDSAVKSLNDVNTFKEVGSPFQSPRSLLSHSHSDSGVEKTESKSEPSFPRGIDSMTKNGRNISKSSNNSDKGRASEKNLSGSTSCKDNNNGLNKSFGSVNSQSSGKHSSYSAKNNSLSSDKKIRSVHVLRHDCVIKTREKGMNDDSRDTDKALSSSSEFSQEDKDSSSFSNHPKIIDVVSQDVDTLRSSVSENDSSLDVIDKVTKVNHPRDNFTVGQKSFGKALNTNCPSLKQGDLDKGVFDPTKPRVFDDVHISQFQLTDKQKDLKEALAKRSENNQPKRKQVQPQIIHHKQSHNEDSYSESKENMSDTAPGVSTNVGPPVGDSAVTAAVAASAAVAATQPFLKIQHDLEAQIKQLVTQLAEIQQSKSSTRSVSSPEAKTSSGKRISDLEHQVAELNERRLEHIESLQQQQFQMQAQLLMMSRSKDPSIELYSTKRQKSPFRGTNNGSQIPRPITRDSKSVPMNSYHPSSSYHLHDSALGQSQSSTFHPNTISKHHNYLSEVRELQGSLLDTPAPRKNIPQPTPYILPEEQSKHLGFLQELLDKKETPSHDTTFSVPPGYEQNRNNNSRLGGRRRDKSPVDQARRLMSSITNLEKETADSIWGSKEDLTSKIDRYRGPAPLDQYLKYPETKSSPYPTLNDIKKKTKHDQRPNLEDILEAKKVLRQLETTRETLEKNIEQVVKNSRDVHVFSALLANTADGRPSDNTRIERMVRKKIASLNEDVQREVIRGLAEEEAKKAAAEAELIRLKNAMKKNPGRYETTKSRQATKQWPDYNTKLTGKNGLFVPSTSSKATKPTMSKVKQPPKPTTIKDEKTMTRTYGKPEYQRGRTTIREPYMHFQNTKKGKPSVMNESMMSRDGRSKSPNTKRQQSPVRTNQAPRQFFFSPTRGYIPVDNTAGPIQGEMVPMAIPLGQPRLEPGVRSSSKPVPAASASNPITSTPVPVTAETKNAAVVSFLMKQQEYQETREPELTKQVLPPIDIDSISPSSSRITDIQIRSPQQANPNVTFLQQTHNSDLDKTLTEEDYSADEQEGVGLEYPGHDAKIPEYTGPAFPPSKARQDHIVGDQPAEQPLLVSDVMAEDMRRKDVLENNAINWLEQELMARVLTEVIPLQVGANAADISEARSEKSEASDKEESLLVADMIGHGGLQLFIDAGQPVDNRLVNVLVAEVIKEKINTMLANKEFDPSQPTRGMSHVVDDQGMGDAAGMDAMEKKMPSHQRVPTPEPTPKTSPITSPRRDNKPPSHHTQAPVTPPLSPPADGFTFTKRPTAEYERDMDQPKPVQITAPPAVVQEPVVPAATVEVPDAKNILVVEQESDSDITVSVSVDISEELRRVSAQGKKPEQPSMPVQICHDVSTPPISPLPEKEEKHESFFPYKQTTPPASPPPTQPQPVVIAPPSPHRQRSEESVEEEEEEEEEEEYVEPKKIMTSVAVGDDSPMMLSLMRTQEKPRSPSPKRERLRSNHSSAADTTLSEESSVSETVNESISEGQWLLSRSEGQIVGLAGRMGAGDLRRGYLQMVDLSTASTLHDTEDLDMDTVSGKSEGEVVVPRGLPAPDQDPMLALMVQMQKNPRLAGFRDIPDSHIGQMVGETVRANETGRSLGELSVGQVPPSRIIKVQSRNNGQKQKRGRGSPVYSPSGSLDRSGADDYSFEERRGRRERESPHRHHHQNHRNQHQRSPTPPHYREHEQARSQGRSRTPEFGQRPRSPAEHRRQDSPVHRADLRERSRKQMQYQPVLSEGAPMSTRRQQSRSGYRGQRRSSDNYQSQRSFSADRDMRHSRESAASEPSYTSNAYSMDPTSRSLETGSFRRSGDGVLTSSLKSRQSAVKKSVEFDLTGTYEQQRREITRSSVSASRDSQRSMESSSRLSDQSRSLGINYSYSMDDSIDDSELKRIVGGTGTGTHTGPYRMSVTLPSTYGDDSDISDFNM